MGMKSEGLNLGSWILPVAFVVGGILVGFVFERFVRKYLKRLADKTKAEIDNIVIAAIGGMPIVWFSALGVYLGVSSIPLKPNIAEIILKALVVIIVLSITIVLTKIVGGYINLQTRKQEGFPSVTIFVNIARLIIFIIGVLIVLEYLGISIAPILTALGVGGLAVALALQDTLSNFFAGIQILAARKLKQGDYIKLESGDEGFVTDITWRNTTIRTMQNNLIVVPNAKLASSIITNYHQPQKEVQVRVDVGVSYDSDLEKVERITIEVAKAVMKEHPGGVPEFEPFIRYSAFADFSINFTVFMRAKEFTDQFPIRHEFIKRLHKRYSEEGIVIPFPIRTVHIRKSS